MKYLSLVLVGFKRLRLNDTRRFSINLTEMIQLILGTNGSGKSSLLREMTPLPSDKDDYYKYGSKTIEISDKGNYYTLTSTFDPSPRHSFKKNGEEINPGGTREVQRKLCLQEFGITPEIHEMLLGAERFTRMGTGKRREWLMRLSNNDYDYALAVYDRLKNQANDIAGTLRMTKKRLVTEQAKVISAEEEKKLNDEVNQIHRELNVLMENRAPLTKPVEAYQSEQDRMLEELNTLTKRLFKIRFLAPYGHYPGGTKVRNEWGELVRPEFQSLDEISNVIDHIRHEITSCDVLMNRAIAEHEKYSKQFEVLSKAGEQGVASLRERVKKINQRKLDLIASRLLNNTKVEIDAVDPTHGLGAWESVTDTLQELFMTIPENAERQYSQQALKVLEEQILVKETERLTIVNAAQKLHARKSHMDAHKENNETTCPKCNHHWRAGYDEAQYTVIVNQIAEHEKSLEVIVKAISELKERAQTNREYGEMFRSYVRLTQSWPILGPIWSYLQDEQFITHKPRAALPLFDRIRHDLQVMVAVSKLDVELVEVAQLIKAAEQMGDATLLDVKLKLEECTLDVEKFTAQRNNLQVGLAEYNEYYKRLDEGIELGEKIKDLRENIVQCNSDLVEMMRREAIAHCIRQLQSTLSRKEEVLSYVTLQKGLIEDMAQQIVELTIKDEAAKLLVKKLSPTEGLIAEGLLGFIKHFIGQMNSLIRKIWSYPLVVKDCAVSEEGKTELDYKFPLIVDNSPDPVPDIGLGSTGIMDVIDMAFKVSAMQHLGLGETPLYLDEPGASFDPEHRHAASLAINSLMENESFTQLFMVSHYESSYSAMANAEICVLCTTNITVPGGTKYNQHVTFN